MILSRRAMLLMGIAFLMSVLLLGAHLAALGLVVAIAAVLLRLLSARDLIPTPSRKVVRILSIAGFVAIIISKLIGSSWGDAAVSLLVLGCALKFLEFYSKHDACVQCTAIFFLSTVPYIFHYEVYMAPYLLLMPVLSIWMFLAVSSQDGILHELKVLAAIALPAIPLTVLIFFVVPRPGTTGTMWALPQSVVSNNDVSGVSGEFSPGDTTSVVRSGELAARVIYYSDKIPKDRYFKSVTYEYCAGKRWYQSQFSQRYLHRLRYRFIPDDEVRRPLEAKDAIAYRVMVEPRGTQFVPSLTGSASSSHDVFFLAGGSYATREPIQSRVAIEFSYPGKVRDEAPRGRYLEELLYLPPRMNPLTRQLVERLMRNAKSETDLAYSFMMNFAAGYTYTLEPGAFGFNDTDELLFKKKKGFCGHYAQALAVMFRMAGIPSRIVGGYAGGKMHNGYLILRDYDAHAWTEAYINGAWERFDVVSLLSSGGVGNEVEDELRRNFEPSMTLTRFLADAKEYLDYQWSLWVLNFDEGARQSFMGSWRGLALFTGVPVCVIVVAVLFIWYKRRRALLPKEIQIIKALWAECAHLGFVPEISAEPQGFAQGLPEGEVRSSFTALAQTYDLIRYGKPCGDAERTKLIKKLESQRDAALEALKKYRREHKSE